MRGAHDDFVSRFVAFLDASHDLGFNRAGPGGVEAGGDMPLMDDRLQAVAHVVDRVHLGPRLAGSVLEQGEERWYREEVVLHEAQAVPRAGPAEFDDLRLASAGTMDEAVQV